jgi:predicted CopG family antitoxin
MSAATGTKRESTTLSVHRDVHSRLETLKPYESMSYSEFLDELADVYEREASA